jgi:hypothetical protein
VVVFVLGNEHDAGLFGGRLENGRVCHWNAVRVDGDQPHRTRLKPLETALKQLWYLCASDGHLHVGALDRLGQFSLANHSLVLFGRDRDELDGRRVSVFLFHDRLFFVLLRHLF